MAPLDDRPSPGELLDASLAADAEQLTEVLIADVAEGGHGVLRSLVEALMVVANDTAVGPGRSAPALRAHATRALGEAHAHADWLAEGDASDRR